jgi:hypothetical protein
MSVPKRRLEILIDESRYRRVVARARERNSSVTAVIREAIDNLLPSDSDRKRRAARELLAAEPMPLPETAEELKAEIRNSRARA